ncbi:MAG: TolC family protein [Piscinibacter sp.]|nr:TolC family protein [Piscinibacter sp.]
MAVLVPPAAATDLLQAWHAALAHDKGHAVDSAGHAAAQSRREQASSLWRPQVGLTAGVGLSTHETDTQGAQFSAPGFGQSGGVGFATSVSQGASARWAVGATMPLYNPERRARQQQLNLSVDAADLEWQAAAQGLMLRTAERYFDVALAEEAVQVLERQRQAVQRAATEAQDRFQLGAVPVTDTHEARARLAGLQAQRLAADSDLQNKRAVLADSTGLPPDSLRTQLPAGAQVPVALTPLEQWLVEAQAGNPAVRGQRLALEVARQEAARYSRAASASVELVAQAGRDRLSGSGDFGAAGNSATTRLVGIQLLVPLYSGGYRSARQDEALKLVDKAAAEVERSSQQVAQQVRAAWRGLSVGQERLRAMEEALAATLSRADATRTGRDVGQRTTLDLLNAENDAAAARLALAQARVALLLDRLRLSALVGRLDEAALRAANAELTPRQP